MDGAGIMDGTAAVTMAVQAMAVALATLVVRALWAVLDSRAARQVAEQWVTGSAVAL